MLEKDGVFYPDTLVGTDSHTTMINGLGIVGWGVGGIEAEAGMLGQPVYFLTPDVVGVHLTGALQPGVTATDLVLTITEMLREAKVVGKFVEFHGEGAASLSVTGPRDHRQHGARIRRDHGLSSRSTRSPAATCRRPAGPTEQVDAFRSYFKAQGLFGMPRRGRDRLQPAPGAGPGRPSRPSVAGPKRPQDRIDLPEVKDQVPRAAPQAAHESGYNKPLDGAEQAVRHPDRVSTDVGPHRTCR